MENRIIFSFFIDAVKGSSFPLSWGTGFLANDIMEDDPTLAECEREKDFRRFYNTQFSPWLLQCIAYQQLYATSNIVDAKGEILEAAFSNPAKQKVYSFIRQYHGQTHLIMNHYNLLAMKHGMNGAYIAIPEEKRSRPNSICRNWV